MVVDEEAAQSQTSATVASDGRAAVAIGLLAVALIAFVIVSLV